MASNRNKRRRAHDKRTLARTVMVHAPTLGLDTLKLKREPHVDLSVHLISPVYRGGEIWKRARGAYMGYTQTNDEIFTDWIVKAVEGQ
jgi:hypothetical protein